LPRRRPRGGNHPPRRRGRVRGMSAAAEEYRAAHRAAILVDRSDLGRLALRGRDALDLLHRLTTNGIKDLRPGQGAATLFTTPKGRILDLVLLHRLEDEILALTGPGRSQPVASWIERFTIREEVRVEDLSAARGTLGLFGAQAARAVSGLFGEEAARRPLHDPHRRSEEHTSELQSRSDLVCRLLLEKKK